MSIVIIAASILSYAEMLMLRNLGVSRFVQTIPQQHIESKPIPEIILELELHNNKNRDMIIASCTQEAPLLVVPTPRFYFQQCCRILVGYKTILFYPTGFK